MKPDGTFYRQQWLGNLEFMNYRLSLSDGTRLFIEHHRWYSFGFGLSGA